MQPVNVMQAMAAAIAATMFSGCVPKPDAVCAHIMELRDIDHPSTDALHRARRVADCTVRMEAARVANGEAYRTAAKCIMALNGAGQRTALGLCMLPMPYIGPSPTPSSATPGVGAMQPVLTPAMDPRTVEPCVPECQASGATPGTPAYMACFSACTSRRAAVINSGIH